MSAPRIKVEGLQELNRTLRRAKDRNLVKAVGRANKQVGRLFIDRYLDPKPTPQAVGRGGGSSVRPSAAKRELKLRVGGKHRADNQPVGQWGRRTVRGRDADGRFLPAPSRPYIIESAFRRRDEISRLWLEQIATELGRDGLEMDT